jgi:hypothetical protein
VSPPIGVGQPAARPFFESVQDALERGKCATKSYKTPRARSFLALGSVRSRATSDSSCPPRSHNASLRDTTPVSSVSLAASELVAPALFGGGRSPPPLNGGGHGTHGAEAPTQQLLV